MLIDQWHIPATDLNSLEIHPPASLTIIFGSRKLLENKTVRDSLFKHFQKNYVSVSTAGEIFNDAVYDDMLVIHRIAFSSSTVRFGLSNIKDFPSSYDAGKSLMQGIPTDGLRHTLVFCDGTRINGTELVKGIKESLPSDVTVTGGLAGDGGFFKKTLVGLNRNIKPGNIVAIGFYGENLKISHGSMGGLDSFGPDRLVTKSDKNVLYELDDKPALDLYKRYLGDLADKLPASALLFPLSIKSEESNSPLVRTILSVNEKDKSMTFAGNIPAGSYARLMKANFDRLIDAAGSAAEACEPLTRAASQFALLISCVGRKMALNQRIDEEIEAVRHVFGETAIMGGFYSYGEISPLVKGDACELLNQTMTITTFAEI